MKDFIPRQLSYRFFDTNKNKLIFYCGPEYPSTANIELAGLPTLNSAEIRIFNLNSNVMNLLSFLNYKSLEISNITVECLVDKEIVFRGDVIESMPIYDIPNPYLQVKAMTDIYYMVKQSKDIVYNIPEDKYSIVVSIKDIINQIFSDTKKNISYYGVDKVNITNPRYLGSKIQQLEKIKEEAQINIVLNFDSVIVFPKLKIVRIGKIINIDGNGNKIVNQIKNDKEGINATFLFNNLITMGKTIRITDCKLNIQANGEFIIYDVRHSLSCNIPNGDFFTEIKARYLSEAQ